MYRIGLDAGSVAVKVIILDNGGVPVFNLYRRHYGHPVAVAHELLAEAEHRYPGAFLSITGAGGRIIGSILGIRPHNELVAQSFSVRKLHPGTRTIFELGGEDSKLILLEKGRIRDFALNSVCAAGTGSFLEQQAERLRLSIEEFGEIAARSVRPSKIAGRCSVFAKSDMIHLQQIATPMEDIVAGLCYAVARNFKGAIAMGREIREPVVFQGGVAANPGMIRAFQEVFRLNEIIIPERFAFMGALGAALRDLDEGLKNRFDLSLLSGYLSSSRNAGEGYPPLVSAQDNFFNRHSGKTLEQKNTGESLSENRRVAFLGIDIGSISTNLAVLDRESNLLAKRYLMTAGRPIDAVMQGLREISEELGDTVEIAGVGTTGSGRYMIADFVGADVVRNEITAQATAALWIDESVDTIFEIGGQDSKYISIRDGIITDFEMNKACAAGTGSFLEEQAEKLNVSVRNQFAEMAFSAPAPCRLGERCTVFMENSLMANLQRGAEKDNLLAGLAYSIVQNYINRVVAGKPIGGNIFFQGGVAFNKSVVAAFEKYLSMKVTVPPNHDVTGAIGMALIAQKAMTVPGDVMNRSMFKGFSLSERRYNLHSFACGGCPNVCEINRVKIEEEDGFLYYGGRCEKYDIRKGQGSALPDAFAFREEMLWSSHLRYSALRNEAASPGAGKKIGIPNIFFFQDFLPFWSTLLWELGFETVVSPKTNKEVINLGLENVLSEACFPVKVAHGHVAALMKNGIDAVFMPSFVNMNQKRDEFSRGLSCPHTQTIPYVSKVALRGIPLLTPVIDFSRGEKHLIRELFRVFRPFGIQKHAIERAIHFAQVEQERFREAIKAKGRELLGLITDGKVPSPAVIIVGRAYNSYDIGMNLEITRKLAHLNVFSLPMDFLPLGQEKLGEDWPNMYWRSGQRILKAARIISSSPDLFAVYIGNFSCGPDSFILKYFRKEMKDKPFLHLEIDEHSADAGAVTRCEAFLDSIAQQRGRDKTAATSGDPLFMHPEPEFSGKRITIVSPSPIRKRTVYIPRMADHSFALKAAFEHCGVGSEVLDESTKESVEIGKRYVSGKECYPYVVTAGDMLKKIFSPEFRPEESAFFMPSGSGPCRFGQYNVAHSLILGDLGIADVPIFSPNQDVQFYRDLGIVGKDFSLRAWKGIIAYSLLTKCIHEKRPYEKNSGDTEELYVRYHEKIHDAIRAKNGALDDVLSNMRSAFEALPVKRERRPVVGIVGEIFVRSHRFSNEDLVRKIEASGGEVQLAPLEEWVHYVNAISLRKALIKRDTSAMMSIFLKQFFQKKVEHRYGRLFKGVLKTAGEPETSELIKKASPYVHDSFEGETILSVGKTIDLIEKGARGIVNAMPFGCMPGTIVTAFLKAINSEYGVPCISIPYDGTESPTTELQIEAFMETIHANTDIAGSTGR